MRRDLVVAVISVCFAACSSGDGGEAASDSGDKASADADASVSEDARVEEESDDGGLDAGKSPGLDAGSSGDAGRDGGRDGGALRDAGPDISTEAGSGGGAGCAGKSYKLCEDFESAGAGALPSGWTKVTAWGGGDALVAEDEAHSGSKSLKGADTATGQTRAGKSLSALGATADKHWGRIFFKVRSPATLPPALDPPNHPVIHNTLVGLKNSTESRVVDTVVNDQGKVQFLYNLPDDSCCQGSAYSYTPYDGKWHCAEWFVDSGAKQYRFFYDGAEVDTKFNASKAKLGQYTQVIVGWIDYQTSKMPYNQAWFDDLAIDDNRVGCD